MIITPKTRGFICTTAHPDGCEANVLADSQYAANHPAEHGPKNILVLGSSTGYGLAARIAAAFAYDANTIGVFFERPAAGKRTATAGWYNTVAFEKITSTLETSHHSINGDAFSDEIKAETIQSIKDTFPSGKVDMIIYSLAAPKRTDPADGVTYSSVIQPIGQPFHSKTVDFHSGEVTEITVAPATPQEVQETIKVMGGEDWLLWVKALAKADVLAEHLSTVALSYLGPELTHPVYKDGTIGKAKEDLETKAKEIDSLLSHLGGKAFVSVNKALVTQSSSAIPVVPLYISLLFRVMKEQGTHENTMEQMLRMMGRIYDMPLSDDWAQVQTDEHGRLRLDDLEMKEDVQEKVRALWETVNTENLETLGDLAGYRHDFFALFGFGIDGIDYDAKTAVERP